MQPIVDPFGQNIQRLKIDKGGHWWTHVGKPSKSREINNKCNQW